MTQDDRLTRFLGILADHKDQLGLSPNIYGFADDNRFSFNMSTKMRSFANRLFYKFGPALGMSFLEDPVPREIKVDLTKVRK